MPEGQPSHSSSREARTVYSGREGIAGEGAAQYVCSAIAHEDEVIALRPGAVEPQVLEKGIQDGPWDGHRSGILGLRHPLLEGVAAILVYDDATVGELLAQWIDVAYAKADGFIPPRRQPCPHEN